jgi:hypothetical protein
LGSFLINTEVAKILGYSFNGKINALISAKNVFGCILGDFSQTHLVTMYSGHFRPG